MDGVVSRAALVRHTIYALAAAGAFTLASRF
jgi:hypothetical protein